MFELPECTVLTEQINDSLHGRMIESGELGNSPHKFVWYNRSHDEFRDLTRGRRIGTAYTRGRWMFIPLEPGFVLLLGECGGKLLLHAPGMPLPKKYHLLLSFDDGSSLTMTTQMWGAMELYKKGEEQEREYVKGMRTTPAEPEFTFSYFTGLIEDAAAGKKRSAKSLLTQEQTIPGLGNAIAQDILYRAKTHPRQPVAELDDGQIQALFRAVVDTVSEVKEKGGRYDEYNLYNQPGGYVRLMDRQSVGTPCPECGMHIEKIQYLGGACYLCPGCQSMS